MAIKALKTKILRVNVMTAYSNSVRSGNFSEARLLLQLLLNGKVKLGLGDAHYMVERMLEKFGCRITYSRNCNIATAYLTPKQ